MSFFFYFFSDEFWEIITMQKRQIHLGMIVLANSRSGFPKYKEKRISLLTPEY